jgi:GTP-binding protein Era
MSYRSGIVALAGRPNVGKSTLANALSGRHVAAVSPRPQTTRRRVVAVASGPEWQAVLLDLPGFQRPADNLTERMQRSVDAGLVDCDAALFVLNASEPTGRGAQFIAERLRAAKLPVIVVLNQVDLVGPPEIARQIAAAATLVDMVALHPVSALTGDGLAALQVDLGALLEEGPRYFPEGMATNQTDEEISGELIREAALQRLRQEIPHALAVDVEEISTSKNGRVVHARILVETESQKGIVVGKAGSMIAAIGQAAREQLARLWGVPVHTDITVKVRPRWRRDDAMLDRLGI